MAVPVHIQTHTSVSATWVMPQILANELTEVSTHWSGGWLEKSIRAVLIFTDSWSWLLVHFRGKVKNATYTTWIEPQSSQVRVGRQTQKLESEKEYEA